MSVFQDSLLVSEVPDWIDLLQHAQVPKPDEAIIRVDFEPAPENEGEPEKANANLQKTKRV
jgi:hypothetical protein